MSCASHLPNPIHKKVPAPWDRSAGTGIVHRAEVGGGRTVHPRLAARNATTAPKPGALVSNRGGRQVFWLTDRPTGHAFSARASRPCGQMAWFGFRPRLQRRVRGGIAPPSLESARVGGHLQPHSIHLCRFRSRRGARSCGRLGRSLALPNPGAKHGATYWPRVWRLGRGVSSPITTEIRLACGRPRGASQRQPDGPRSRSGRGRGRSAPRRPAVHWRHSRRP